MVIKQRRRSLSVSCGSAVSVTENTIIRTLLPSTRTDVYIFRAINISTFSISLQFQKQSTSNIYLYTQLKFSILFLYLMCFILFKGFPVLPAAVEPDLSPPWLKILIFHSQHSSSWHWQLPFLLLLCTFMFIIQLIQCRYCNKYHMQTNNGEQTRATSN
uniref:Uncharacterized protein n=1 Tax=Oryzias latipes TaxID=8090 RepID=A0A3B3IA21_ORYLA